MQAGQNWTEAEKDISSRVRYNLRSRGKRLAQQGAARIGWCESVEESDKAIAFLFKRKAQWLKEQGQHSPWLDRTEVPEFFRRLVRATDNPVVAAVQVDGAPVAVTVCVAGSRAVEPSIIAFDPEYAAFGPAHLLNRFLAEWAIERRREFDFGLTVTDHKKQWPVEYRSYITRKVMLTMRGRVPEPSEVARLVARLARRKLGGVR